MKQKWTVTVWGTRGSFPMASADFLEFGGNTSCVCAGCGEELVIFDVGSGIAGLSGLLARRGGPKKLHLLIWDATFIPGELKPGWGHSTWEQGAALGKRAGAKTVLMTHFSHQYNDTALREQERLALAAGPAVRFARERMELEL